MKILCGIYKIKDLRTDKIYIGSSTNIFRRFQYHLNDLKKQKHVNSYMQRVYNKSKNFKFDVVIICKKEDLLFYEQLCINFFNPDLNISKIAGRIEMNEYTKRKISLSNIGISRGKGVPKSKEFIEKITGRKRPEFALMLTGRKRPDHSQKMLGNKNSRGKRSEETKRRNCQARLGKKWDINTKIKMSFSHLVRNLSYWGS